MVDSVLSSWLLFFHEKQRLWWHLWLFQQQESLLLNDKQKGNRKTRKFLYSIPFPLEASLSFSKSGCFFFLSRQWILFSRLTSPPLLVLQPRILFMMTKKRRRPAFVSSLGKERSHFLCLDHSVLPFISRVSPVASNYSTKLYDVGKKCFLLRCVSTRFATQTGEDTWSYTKGEK